MKLQQLVAANTANIITNKIRGTTTGTNNVANAALKKKKERF
jgi:hypothetical protein